MIYILLYISMVFISSCSQILLKKSSNIEYNSKIREYVNFYVIIAYGIFFLATIGNIFAYKHIPLSLGYLLESTGYVFTLILGKIFFNEKITKNKIIGISFIILGFIILVI